MRVAIFCDMEGVSCIENWEQVSADKPLYEEGRELYTEVILGCFCLAYTNYTQYSHSQYIEMDELN